MKIKPEKICFNGIPFEFKPAFLFLFFCFCCCCFVCFLLFFHVFKWISLRSHRSFIQNSSSCEKEAGKNMLERNPVQAWLFFMCLNGLASLTKVVKLCIDPLEWKEGFIEFQFKFLHRRVPTNNFLFRIGLQGDEKCSFSHTYSESIIHLFWSCRQASYFWNKLTEWLKNLNLLPRDYALTNITALIGSEARYLSICASYKLLLSLSTISHMAR